MTWEWVILILGIWWGIVIVSTAMMIYTGAKNLKAAGTTILNLQKDL